MAVQKTSDIIESLFYFNDIEKYSPTFRFAKEKQLKIKYYSMLLNHKDSVCLISFGNILKFCFEKRFMDFCGNIYWDLISTYSLFIYGFLVAFHFLANFLVFCNVKSKIELGIFLIPYFVVLEWLMNIAKLSFYLSFESDVEKSEQLLMYMVFLLIFFLPILKFAAFTEKIYEVYQSIKSYEKRLEENDLFDNDKTVITALK